MFWFHGFSDTQVVKGLLRHRASYLLMGPARLERAPLSTLSTVPPARRRNYRVTAGGKHRKPRVKDGKASVLHDSVHERKRR